MTNPSRSELGTTPQDTVEVHTPHLYKIGEIDTSPEGQAKRGWKVSINGEPVDAPISSIKFENERMGITFDYGQRQEGFDGLIIREPGGGGAITAPYMIDNEGQIFIGVVLEGRPTMSAEPVLNVPRGMLNPGETHRQGAEREMLEETGFDADYTPEEIERGRKFAVISRFTLLKAGLNSNATFFDTTVPTEDGGQSGISLYSFEVAQDELQKVTDEDGSEMYVFKPELLQATNLDKGTEKIYGSRFVPLSVAMQSDDMFTSAAAGQIVAAFLDGRLRHPVLNSVYNKS